MLKKYKEFNENIEWEFNEDETDDILPEFVGHEVFYNFLVRRNILDKYINNYNKYRFKNLTIKELLDSHEKGSYINSFRWDFSKEGHVFWSKINGEWGDIWFRF